MAVVTGLGYLTRLLASKEVLEYSLQHLKGMRGEDFRLTLIPILRLPQPVRALLILLQLFTVSTEVVIPILMVAFIGPLLEGIR